MGAMMRDCGGSVLKDCALQSPGPSCVVRTLQPPTTHNRLFVHRAIRQVEPRRREITRLRRLGVTLKSERVPLEDEVSAAGVASLTHSRY